MSASGHIEDRSFRTNDSPYDSKEGTESHHKLSYVRQACGHSNVSLAVWKKLSTISEISIKEGGKTHLVRKAVRRGTTHRKPEVNCGPATWTYSTRTFAHCICGREYKHHELEESLCKGGPSGEVWLLLVGSQSLAEMYSFCIQSHCQILGQPNGSNASVHGRSHKEGNCPTPTWHSRTGLETRSHNTTDVSHPRLLNSCGLSLVSLNEPGLSFFFILHRMLG